MLDPVVLQAVDKVFLCHGNEPVQFCSIMFGSSLPIDVAASAGVQSCRLFVPFIRAGKPRIRIGHEVSGELSGTSGLPFQGE